MDRLHYGMWRLRQKVRGILRPRRPDTQTVAEGTGAVFSVGSLLREQFLQRPMVVWQAGGEKARDMVFHSLREADFSWSDCAAPDRAVTETEANALALSFLREGCDCFVAVGRFPVPDLCKAAAALAFSGGRGIASLSTPWGMPRRVPQVAAVPTSPGAGAQSTGWASVRLEEGGRLVTLDHRGLVPALCVLDPDLPADLPREVLVPDIMEGLSLAVEAYTSLYADDGARASAADAVRGFFAAAEPCFNTGGTQDERSALLHCSRLAGMTARQVGAGYARALAVCGSESLGSAPGELLGVLLPAVLKRGGRRFTLRLAELAGFCDLGQGEPPEERAALFLSRLDRLIFRLGMPDSLPPLGADSATVMATRAADLCNRRWSQPVLWDSGDLYDLLHTAAGAV